MKAEPSGGPPLGVVRVMTLNTLYRPPVESRWAEIAAWLTAEKPDVVCLQEVHEQLDGMNVAHWLSEQLPGDWHVALGTRPDGSGRQFGNAVVSRWPIESREAFDLPCSDAFPRLLLHVRTNSFDVYSAHLTADPAAAPVRDEQVLRIDEIISATADPQSPLPPILAGDFNAPPGASAIAFLRGETALLGRGTFFQDAWAVAGDGTRGVTWDHRNPLTPPAFLMDARCDYIFVGLPKVPIGWSEGAEYADQPAGQVMAARLVCNSPATGVYASDHYGVIAEVCWPGSTKRATD